MTDWFAKVGQVTFGLGLIEITHNIFLLLIEISQC